MRTPTRQKRMTLQELEKSKLRYERRIDGLKREYIKVLEAINFITNELNQSLQVNSSLRR